MPCKIDIIINTTAEELPVLDDIVKFDDAKWHYGGEFPSESPVEYSGTHIGLLLRWCFLKGWAGELHTSEPESQADVAHVVSGRMSGTKFLFKWCDGKFTTEDLSAEGVDFMLVYYNRKDGKNYTLYYGNIFEDLVYTASKTEHNFLKLSRIVDRRYNEYLSGSLV